MNEEAIFSALFNLVSTASGFATTSRRIELWDDPKASQKPALYLYQRDGDYVRDSEAHPEVVTLNADIYIYATASKNRNTIPSTNLNALVSAVRDTLAPNMVTGLNTLGGLVSHCWIEGKALFTPGDLDGDGIAILPVNILVPN